MKQPSNFHTAMAQAETSYNASSNKVLVSALETTYKKGIEYCASQVLPNLQTIEANVGNDKLSDADFRNLVSTIIPDLIERVKE